MDKFNVFEEGRYYRVDLGPDYYAVHEQGTDVVMLVRYDNVGPSARKRFVTEYHAGNPSWVAEITFGDMPQRIDPGSLEEKAMNLLSTAKKS